MNIVQYYVFIVSRPKWFYLLYGYFMLWYIFQEDLYAVLVTYTDGSLVVTMGIFFFLLLNFYLFAYPSLIIQPQQSPTKDISNQITRDDSFTEGVLTGLLLEDILDKK